MLYENRAVEAVESPLQQTRPVTRPLKSSTALQQLYSLYSHTVIQRIHHTALYNTPLRGSPKGVSGSACSAGRSCSEVRFTKFNFETLQKSPPASRLTQKRMLDFLSPTHKLLRSQPRPPQGTQTQPRSTQHTIPPPTHLLPRRGPTRRPHAQ